MSRFYWKKAKAIAMYLNKRQFETEFGTSGPEVEISTEAGVFIISETSSSSTPEYIITE